MESRSETPEELSTWVDTHIETLEARVKFLREVSRVHRGDVAAYLKHITEGSSEIRQSAYEVEYLASVFALTEGHVGATEISKAAGVTPASMYHRLTTKLAKRLLTTVFKNRQLKLPS